MFKTSGKDRYPISLSSFLNKHYYLHSLRSVTWINGNCYFSSQLQLKGEFITKRGLTCTDRQLSKPASITTTPSHCYYTYELIKYILKHVTCSVKLNCNFFFYCFFDFYSFVINTRCDKRYYKHYHDCDKQYFHIV